MAKAHKNVKTQDKNMNASKDDKLENLYKKVEKYVLKLETITTSQIQKDFSIGYKKAAVIIQKLQDNGVVAPAVGKKARVVLKNKEEKMPIQKESVEKKQISNKKINEQPKYEFILGNILTIKEFAFMFGSVLLIVLVMLLSNSLTTNNERQILMDQKTLPLRARFSNEATNAPIQMNDVVTLSYIAYLDKEKVESISTNNNQIIVGKSDFDKSFDEEFIGHKKGDHFEVLVVFPNDYPANELAGKRVNFKVVIKNVTKLRELDDNLVQELAKEGRKIGNEEIASLSNVNDLENYIEKLIEMQKQIQEFNLENQQNNE